jgi:hypothetical protein
VGGLQHNEAMPPLLAGAGPLLALAGRVSSMGIAAVVFFVIVTLS